MNCRVCDADWTDGPGWWMVDVRVSADDAFVTVIPCCQVMQDEIGRWGYDDTVGRSLVDVVREITARDVLEITEDDDGHVVCRLALRDGGFRVTSTILKDGRPAAVSAVSGWQKQVFADISLHHRHHDPPQGWKFGLAFYNGGVKVGVATVGRPVARAYDDGTRLEVTRVATWGPSALRKNAVSKLYAAAASRARSMGYSSIITYTIHEIESGASLMASGWTAVSITDGGEWVCKARPNASTTAPTGRKVCWHRGLNKTAARCIRRKAITIESTNQEQS